MFKLTFDNPIYAINFFYTRHKNVNTDENIYLYIFFFISNTPGCIEFKTYGKFSLCLQFSLKTKMVFTKYDAEKKLTKPFLFYVSKAFHFSFWLLFFFFFIFGKCFFFFYAIELFFYKIFYLGCYMYYIINKVDDTKWNIIKSQRDKKKITHKQHIPIFLFWCMLFRFFL